MSDDATGWFEPLYAGARAGERAVPWARGGPHPLLVEWVEREALDGTGRRALVVGAGLGHDAEYLASLGFATVAFDVAPSAVRMARERFSESAVEYAVADLLDPPADWSRAFDFVFESLTVQSLPPALHPAASAAVAWFVAPGGELLVVASARELGERVHGPPWPLARPEVDAFADSGLVPVSLELLPVRDEPTERRWRAAFSRG
jgi:SAM-dependent methyltransferase